jgi:hypothetical protein
LGFGQKTGKDLQKLVCVKAKKRAFGQIFAMIQLQLWAMIFGLSVKKYRQAPDKTRSHAHPQKRSIQP